MKGLAGGDQLETEKFSSLGHRIYTDCAGGKMWHFVSVRLHHMEISRSVKFGPHGTNGALTVKLQRILPLT